MDRVAVARLLTRSAGSRCLGRSLPPSNTKAFLPLGLQVRDSGSTSTYFILFE